MRVSGGVIVLFIGPIPPWPRLRRAWMSFDFVLPGRRGNIGEQLIGRKRRYVSIEHTRHTASYEPEDRNSSANDEHYSRPIGPIVGQKETVYTLIHYRDERPEAEMMEARNRRNF